MSARYEITEDADPRALVEVSILLRPSAMLDEDDEMFVQGFRAAYDRWADAALVQAIHARDAWLDTRAVRA
jgi:hypothetical protein